MKKVNYNKYIIVIYITKISANAPTVTSPSSTRYRLSSYGLRAIFDSDIVYTCNLDRIHD